MVSTDPDPGDRVLKDGTVGAVISLGPERHKVPDVRGQTLDDAQQALDEAKLAYGDAVERYDEKIAKGRVITHRPRARHRAAPQHRRRRRGQQGPAPDQDPRLHRQARRAGRRARWRSAASRSTPTEVNDDTVPKGRVISQSPDSGTGQKGDVISLVVSKGPVMVEVPNVVGMGLEAATRRLEAAGFRVKVRQPSMYIGVQYVVSHRPRPAAPGAQGQHGHRQHRLSPLRRPADTRDSRQSLPSLQSHW